jgi:D-alanyl-D-alanine carboxypeptidase
MLVLLVFPMIAPRADEVDRFIKGEMDRHSIPGLNLEVIRKGEPIKVASYGLANLELQARVNPGTVFEIGSITKQFTSAGILLLAQDGKLSVEDKISKYFKQMPESWANITIRHLLTHTSGIKSYTGLNGFELTKHLTQEEFIKAIMVQPLEFQPGAKWKYCNTGFNLLGYIIENVSGQTYWDYMKQRVFGPLQMGHTQDRLPRSVIPNRAAGYEQTNQIRINRDYDLTDVFAAGALVSTLEDLAKWSKSLDLEAPLHTTTKNQMWTPAKLNSGQLTKYGFGWFIDSVEGHANIGHGGSTSGFSASIQRFPDDQLVVIVLSNTDEQIATTLAKKVAGFYFGDQKGKAAGSTQQTSGKTQ